MCCGKNRPLALFGATLAICAGSASALLSSHSREPAPQVAPQAENRTADPQHPIGDAEKRLDLRSTKRP
jgi:hypothetical protein